MLAENFFHDHKEVRSLERWDFDRYYYESLDDFIDSKRVLKGIHVVNLNGIPLEFFADLKPGKPILTMFNGAQQRNEFLKLPVFSGFGVSDGNFVAEFL